MKKCPECQSIIVGDKRVMSRKKFCSNTCKSKYRTSSGARVDTHLWTNFRIREKDYEKILMEQDFRCAICRIHQSTQNKAFAVDHDHLCCDGKRCCGKCIRGLLCFECNIGLGKFKDDPEILKKALGYLLS